MPPMVDGADVSGKSIVLMLTITYFLPDGPPGHSPADAPGHRPPRLVLAGGPGAEPDPARRQHAGPAPGALARAAAAGARRQARLPDAGRRGAAGPRRPRAARAGGRRRAGAGAARRGGWPRAPRHQRVDQHLPAAAGAAAL